MKEMLFLAGAEGPIPFMGEKPGPPLLHSSLPDVLTLDEAVDRYRNRLRARYVMEAGDEFTRAAASEYGLTDDEVDRCRNWQERRLWGGALGKSGHAFERESTELRRQLAVGMGWEIVPHVDGEGLIWKGRERARPQWHGCKSLAQLMDTLKVPEYTINPMAMHQVECFLGMLGHRAMQEYVIALSGLTHPGVRNDLIRTFAVAHATPYQKAKAAVEAIEHFRADLPVAPTPEPRPHGFPRIA